MTRLSDQQKIEIVKEYLAGDSSVKIGKKYGVTHVSILSILKYRGVEIRSKKGV